MTDAESRERVRLWTELKPLLERTLGVEGSAHWLAFAARQQMNKAKRVASGNILHIDLPRSAWTP
jgi:hypothetical protein